MEEITVALKITNIAACVALVVIIILFPSEFSTNPGVEGIFFVIPYLLARSTTVLRYQVPVY